MTSFLICVLHQGHPDSQGSPSPRSVLLFSLLLFPFHVVKALTTLNIANSYANPPHFLPPLLSLEAALAYRMSLLASDQPGVGCWQLFSTVETLNYYLYYFSYRQLCTGEGRFYLVRIK